MASLRLRTDDDADDGIGKCPVCCTILPHSNHTGEAHIAGCNNQFQGADDGAADGGVAYDGAAGSTAVADQGNLTIQQHQDHDGSSLRLWSESPDGESERKRRKRLKNIAKAERLLFARCQGVDSRRYEMVMRYIVATRMKKHWEYLGTKHPRWFRYYLWEGYMEPIPTSWVSNGTLAVPSPEGSYYENPAEERLYYLLNHAVMPDGSRQKRMYPLNIVRDRNTIIRRGKQRTKLQVKLDENRLAAYKSLGDVFLADRQTKSNSYSDQVPNPVSPARTKALNELADGIIHGSDDLETMLLIDVSNSMLWDPHRGIRGPDGVRRHHDQPSNLNLVKNLVNRILFHMVSRARKRDPSQYGIPTVTFSDFGRHVGELSAENFARDWNTKVNLGGGTNVMRGWQVVKNAYFEKQNRERGHGYVDSTFGWQPTPGMPKLSLLMFLDGEAPDMDEFELELLGETWAYVTIALVGMENCPHHHSHAIELERISMFNPHVAFYDCHGRVCERMVVEDLLSQVYPVDPPGYEEILRPEYDLPPQQPPGYVA